MRIRIQFHSYFKELTGCAECLEDVVSGETLGALYQRLIHRFPRLSAMEKSTLMAVGVDYQPRTYLLQEGDEVSFFPPVQGG
jgi:molybdopterin converting factor small subunit